MDQVEKSALRKQLIGRRDAIDPAVRAEKSVVICREAFEELSDAFDEFATSVPCEIQGADRAPLVGIYSALGSEVDLRLFEELAWGRGWELAYPVMVKDEGDEFQHMEFYRVPQQKAAAKTDAFLAKPARPIASADGSLLGCDHVEPRDLDAFVVPLVAFDWCNTRLGYGGGNYDRYVPRLRQGIPVVGVAFEEQYQVELPVEAHDCRMALMVTA